MNKEQLYDQLLVVCQEYGFTTEHTHELLQQVVDSIILDGEDQI